MSNESLFSGVFIYLLAAVIAVPVAKKLGLGSVLGYLLAGVVIGPFALEVVGDQTGVMHFAEFGVVMMLFLIGMELKPALLWKMRSPILGLGGLQVTLTMFAIMGIAMALGQPWRYALAIGAVLALSSTAIVMQSLAEKGLMKTTVGQSSFAVLLFQDIAVIPMLALLPLLATLTPEVAVNAHSSGLHLSGWQQALLVTGTITVIIVGGTFAVRPIFRVIAGTRMRELFVAACLLLVIGITLAMQAVGVSPALGAFLAGVVLAENEYRHEIETTIEPFKGLLLGVFFIAVGASIDFRLIAEQPWIILAITAGLMVFKWLLLYALARAFKLSNPQSLTLAFFLAQGGEFAFVLFAFCEQSGILPKELIATLIAAVALSMLLTPLAIMFNERFVQKQILSRLPASKPDDTVENEHNEVIVCGYGRFGQIVTRLVTGSGFNATVLDHDPDQIELLRRFHSKVFYGDPSRPELLESAGAHEAKLIIVAVDGADNVIKIVQMVQKHFPHLKILARAPDRVSAYELMRLNVDVVTREMFGSSLDMGIEALKLLGLRAYKAQRQARLFRHVDEKHLRELASKWDHEINKEFIVEARQKTDLLAEVLKADVLDQDINDDHAWEPAKPKS